MIDISEVAENIYMIDNQLYSAPKWGSVYLLDEEKKALIETGPTTSANVVLDGIKKIGVSPRDINYIIVTHIHLDHAGGAGTLLRNMPQAQVIVHPRGARHMVDPTRLVRGVVEVMGEEEMERCGEVVSIEANRVHGVSDGEIIELGEGQVLQFSDTPGHAPHELCIYESRNGGIFTGDAVGVTPFGILFPYHAPPNFDLDVCIKTLERLMKLEPSAIYFSHFGASHSVQEKLRLAIDKLWIWEGIVDKSVRENNLDKAAQRLVAQACAELESVNKAGPLYEHVTKVHLPLCARGFIKNYRERHKV